jgi:hypothetical protein
MLRPYIKPKEKRKKEKRKQFKKGGKCKKPKGNGINDSLVHWLCVYAVVFWFFIGWVCACHPNFALFFIFYSPQLS